ncbi:MAG: tetratricopeptide repeat protein [Syntrophotaleaceae bacterium]
MSLINQMLKELDKRTPLATEAESGLPGGVVSVETRRSRGKVVWAALIVVLLVGGSMIWFFWPGHPAEERIGSITAAPPENSSGPSAISPTAPMPEQVPAEVEKKPPILENLQFSGNTEGLQVELVFSNMPNYRLIRDDQGRQLALELPAETAPPALPDTSGLPLLLKVAYEKSEGRARLVFVFDEICRHDELSLTANPGQEGQTLRFMIRPDAAAAHQEPVTEPVVAETPVEPADADQGHVPRSETSVAPEFILQAIQTTAGEQSEIICRDGISAFQQGRQREAETAWRAALAIDPGHVRSRDALIHLLLQQGRQSEIKSLLIEGVQKVPGHLPYRLRLARLLIDEDALSSARQELIREPRPSLTEAPDVYAMLATVSQRQGRYDEAAEIYRSLVGFRPKNGVWWMGLGIAFERSNSLDKAMEAYQKALSGEELSDGLRNFIRQRLAVLGQQASQEPDKERS